MGLEADLVCRQTEGCGASPDATAVWTCPTWSFARGRLGSAIDEEGAAGAAGLARGIRNVRNGRKKGIGLGRSPLRSPFPYHQTGLKRWTR